MIPFRKPIVIEEIRVPSSTLQEMMNAPYKDGGSKDGLPDGYHDWYEFWNYNNARSYQRELSFTELTVSIVDYENERLKKAFLDRRSAKKLLDRINLRPLTGIEMFRLATLQKGLVGAELMTYRRGRVFTSPSPFNPEFPEYYYFESVGMCGDRSCFARRSYYRDLASGEQLYFQTSEKEWDSDGMPLLLGTNKE